MGYYTYFKLQLEPENFDIIKEIRNNDPDSDFAWALDDDGNAADSAKWYEWASLYRRRRCHNRRKLSEGADS